MKALAIMTAAALIVTLAMAGIVNAHNRNADDIPRPKPRPIMDCWVDHDTEMTECEVRG